METRQPMFIADEEWLAMPFENYIKTPRERLQDIAVQIPGFLHRMDTYIFNFKPVTISAESTSSLQEQFESLYASYRVLLEDLSSWLSDFYMSHPSPPYWLASQSILNESAGWPQPDRDPVCIPRPAPSELANGSYDLVFGSSQISGMLMHFWSYYLELHSSWLELLQATDGSADLFRKVLSASVHSAKLIKAADLWTTVCVEGRILGRPPLASLSRFETKHGQV